MPAVCTRELTFAGEQVTKTYRQWWRGEPRREWDALVLLQHHAPGLAPATAVRRPQPAGP